MTTSGTYDTVRNFNIIQCIEEAFRRCKIDPSKIESQQLYSARISVDLLLISWVNDGIQQFTVDEQIYTLVGDGTDTSFLLPTGSVDILSMVFRNGHGTDMEISAISRKDYQDISDKNSAGQPVNYWVDKTTIPPLCYLWPVQNIAGTSVVYNRIRQIQDAGAYNNTPDVTVLYMEALIAGIASKIAQKECDPVLEDRLIAAYQMAYENAKDQDRDRAQLVIKPSLGRRF